MDVSAIASRALEHGLNSIEDIDGPLTPFTLVVDANPDLRNRAMALTRHAAETLEECLASAQDSILPGADKTLYAIAWDGYVMVDGRKWDAILVEAGSAEASDGILMAQRYEGTTVGLFKKRRRNVAVGAPLHVGLVASRLWSEG